MNTLPRPHRRLTARGWIILLLLAVILLGLLYWLADSMRLIPRPYYSAEAFHIDTVYSSCDFNNNGRDDYSDILLGARQDAENHPRYLSEYYDTAYPPDNIGVCTDVVWRAFRAAGYDLRQMVDRDIAARPDDYPGVETRDSNIDFRRVGNLHIFFARYAVELSTDINQIAEWQPGDIVIFGQDQHIGIVSDRRNRDGQSFIIHNGGQLWREEDYLSRTGLTVLAHYRFDAALIDQNVLVAWAE